MKLRCIKSMAAHWGVIFEYDKYYDYSICEKKVTFVTNFKVWNNSLSEIVQNGFEIMKLKNKDTDTTWLVNKNKVLEKIKKECEKTLSLPHAVIKSDDRDTVHYFLTLSNNELFQLGADGEKPYFVYSVYRIDEYFDFKSERRDIKLKELGI
jgi:hypothetical protein